ncbi:MAG: hypothetical protein M1818_006982 [Claussenomyces sp. TS43310]|nr:MAG: hypothetical protein M1818_006982 [Claussenomyces sp. TS43310]
MRSSKFLLTGFAASGLAATVTYNWDVTWVSAAPDGFTRPVIGINGQFPCPPIEATVGDQVVVNLNNQLGNQTTSLHWHGISQKGTGEMDGPSGVTQCPIPPGASMTYTFIVDTPGTYWYHSHNHGQYPDGLRGPLIVHDLIDPYAGQYDEEFILRISDWYHDQVPTLLPQLLAATNVHAAPPFPDSLLLNDSSTATLAFQPNKVYKVRVISMSAFCATMLEFDSHEMNVIEVDGVYVTPYETSQIRVAAAQRYSFLLTAKSTADQNYAFTASMDSNRDYSLAATWPTNATGHIIYDGQKALPGSYPVSAWAVFNDQNLSPLDKKALLPAPDNTITMDFNFGFDSLSIPRAYLNNVSYVGQKVPTLYSVLTTGSSASDPRVYGQVNPFIVRLGQTVQIVFNNLDAAIHPLHLHGSWSGSSADFPSTPMRRDVVEVFGQSHLVIRYTADNPGVQLFHCHIEWHVEMGFTATIIEAPISIQSLITVPKQHLSNCQAQGIPTAGNAAGDRSNYTDLTDANTVPPNPDPGATYTTSSTRRGKRQGPFMGKAFQRA